MFSGAGGGTLTILRMSDGGGGALTILRMSDGWWGDTHYIKDV